MTRVERRIQAALDESVASGAEVGIQVAVLHEGRVAVDAVAGDADPGTGEPVGPDTLFFAASAAKGVGSTVAHVLVERGVLAYDQRVAEAWPEFAAHGKGQVTLRDVLLHTAGVPGLWPTIAPEDLCNWDGVCAFIAGAEPWWPPGTETGYHALTWGYVLGEFVRRATGRTLSSILREDVTGPLGVADGVHFGVPDRLLGSVARQVPDDAGPPPPEPGTALDRVVPRGVQPTAAFANRRDILAADIPSQGTMSARGVARMYAALLGHLDGVTLVSPDRREAMAAPAFSGVDQVMGFETTWAFGYSAARPGADSRPGSTFGMFGSNGSAAYADIDSGIAVAVMRNHLTADFDSIGAIDRILAEEFPPR